MHCRSSGSSRWRLLYRWFSGRHLVAGWHHGDGFWVCVLSRCPYAPFLNPRKRRTASFSGSIDADHGPVGIVTWTSVNATESTSSMRLINLTESLFRVIADGRFSRCTTVRISASSHHRHGGRQRRQEIRAVACIGNQCCRAGAVAAGIVAGGALGMVSEPCHCNPCAWTRASNDESNVAADVSDSFTPSPSRPSVCSDLHR